MCRKDCLFRTGFRIRVVGAIGLEPAKVVWSPLVDAALVHACENDAGTAGEDESLHTASTSVGQEQLGSIAVDRIVRIAIHSNSRDCGIVEHTFNPLARLRDRWAVTNIAADDLNSL